MNKKEFHRKLKEIDEEWKNNPRRSAIAEEYRKKYGTITTKELNEQFTI